MGIGWGGMGEGLGRWNVAAYGVSLGIDFANLDWQKTARSGRSVANKFAPFGPHYWDANSRLLNLQRRPQGRRWLG